MFQPQERSVLVHISPARPWRASQKYLSLTQEQRSLLGDSAGVLL